MRSTTQRVDLIVPVFIYGHNEWAEPIKEITKTLTISADGCFVELAAPVSRRYALLAMNMATGQAVACRVTSVQLAPSGKALVGIRFTMPSPRFWGLEFPHEDADHACEERPGPVTACDSQPELSSNLKFCIPV